MGEKTVSTQYDEHQLRAFTRGVLKDLQAIEMMLSREMFESEARRIGAEQEMFLVDSAMRPAPLAMEVLATAKDKRLTTEIGRFNLEANLTPLDFSGDCLSRMEGELNEVIGIVRNATGKFGGDVALCGILPTIRQSDLVIENLTPMPRYYEIDRVIAALNGDSRVVFIKGLDELQMRVQNTFVEFCNTSFQIHLQTGIKDFVRDYNWAQAIAAPVLAPAVNSPILFDHRLWHETRLALFQHATDTRSPVHQARNQPPRVNFGDRWVNDSIVEIFREDAIRFRVLLTQAIEEDSLDILEQGGIPMLAAWRLHNGTIWRWNRPCYGISSDGKPSLRIEARYLPSGPTVADEMANAAFFLGLMMALPAEFGDVTRLMSFDDAKANFFSVARNGLKSQIVWFDGKSRRTQRLIMEELLPRARTGLQMAGIDEADIERFIGIMEHRVGQEKTGAKWMIDSLAAMDPLAKQNVRMRTLVETMKEHQIAGEPLHTWEFAKIPGECRWIDNYRTVEQFMTTDLFTVRPEDVIDLAASLMHWRHVRHVPVEDDAGQLVGIISHRDLLQLTAYGKAGEGSEIIVRDVMKRDPITIAPDTPTLDALLLMREKKIGCLPVVKDGKLVGLVTAHDFLTVSTRLFEEKLRSISYGNKSDDQKSDEQKSDDPLETLFRSLAA